MRADQVLYFLSVIVFTFGALTFCVLTVVYWREWRARQNAGRGLVFPAFTLICAGAFVTNLLYQVLSTAGTDDVWVTAAGIAVALFTGLLSPMLFHVVYEEERKHRAPARTWQGLLAGLYTVGAAGAVSGTLEDQLPAGWSGVVERLPGITFGAAGALGLILMLQSGRGRTPAEKRHRNSIVVLLSLVVLCAALNLAGAGTYLDLLSDYLVLAFFCVTLYYHERLIFFDLFVKRGAFFALALVALSAFFLGEARLVERTGLTWSRPWIGALVLTPFWLMAPWIYSRLALAIDRMWLRRRYAQPEAERRFAQAIQASATVDDLGFAAEASLGDIFQTVAKVDFNAAGEAEPPPNGLIARLPAGGHIALAERADSIPFLSDDHRLLQSLARTLSMVFENVRFREEQARQREREEELSRLASRSELKALRAQINPHFLFNALNAIAGLIPVEPRAAEETVEQLAEVFRYALRRSEKEWVRLDEELEFVASCLRVEQARFGHRLRVSMDVDSATGAIPVPAMSIQPLVENAVKHGASMAEERGEVRLHAAIDGARLRIEVSDNGPGFPAGFSLGDDASGHGLRNIADRLKGYYGAAAELKWESRDGATRVTLAIPCQVPALFANGNDTRTDRG